MQPERYRQVKTLFQHVLALPPEARDGFLRCACADDEDLSDEVRELLLADSEDTTFLEEPVVGSAFRRSTHLAASILPA